MVTSEIKNLRKKLNALQVDGVGLLIGDIFNIIRETLEHQTGLKLKDREGKEVDIVSLVKNLSTLYQEQLNELLAEAEDKPVRQIDLEDSIREIKSE